MPDELLYEARDHVATITFNRPERMNTISMRMLDALSTRLREADTDPAVRAAKRMLRHAATEPLEEHVQRQFLALLPLFRTKDFKEGMASFLEKRPPRFEGR